MSSLFLTELQAIQFYDRKVIWKYRLRLISHNRHYRHHRTSMNSRKWKVFQANFIWYVDIQSFSTLLIRLFLASKVENDKKYNEAATSKADVPFDKPVPGSTLRRLDDPIFDTNPNLSSVRSAAATDDLDKAHDRFDRFWETKKAEDGNNV